MPNRRMFSKKICRSAKFLKMHSEAQRLYFHLGLDTDDDGVVEAYSVMQTAGISEEYFNILVEKGYVIVLNDDLVSYMTDWREHNVIRADRKVDSIYKDLLLEKVPGIKLVEPRKRTSGKKKKSEEQDDGLTLDTQRSDIGQTNDGQMSDKKQSNDRQMIDTNNGKFIDSPSPDNGQTLDRPKENETNFDGQMSDNGQSNDRHLTTNGPLKISKDKLSKDNLIQENLNKENISEDNLSEIKLSKNEKSEKDYNKIKIIFENSLEDITEESINECINYLNYLPTELIEYALIRTGMIKNPNWQYTKTILNSWLSKGINTLQKVKQEEKEFKKNNSVTTDSNNPDGFKRKGEELLNDK